MIVLLEYLSHWNYLLLIKELLIIFRKQVCELKSNLEIRVASARKSFGSWSSPRGRTSKANTSRISVYGSPRYAKPSKDTLPWILTVPIIGCQLVQSQQKEPIEFYLVSVCYHPCLRTTVALMPMKSLKESIRIRISGDLATPNLPPIRLPSTTSSSCRNRWT